MVRIGVLFELDVVETRHGEGVCVLGCRSELGCWNSKSARNMTLQLRTSAVMYPCWATFRPIWLELPAGGDKLVQFEYKYVVHRAGSQMMWEDSIPNRSVELPVQDGSIWLVSDERWDCAAEPTSLSSVTPIEVTERWRSFNPESFDPLWMPAESKRDPTPELSGEPSFFALTPDDSSEFGSREEEEHSIVDEFSVLATPTSEAIASLQAENAMLRERVRSLSATLECLEESAGWVRPPESNESCKPSQRSEAEQCAKDDLLNAPQLGRGDQDDKCFVDLLASRLKRLEEHHATNEDAIAVALRSFAWEILDIQRSRKSDEESATKEGVVPLTSSPCAGDVSIADTQLSARAASQVETSEMGCSTDEGSAALFSQSGGEELGASQPSTPHVLPSQGSEEECLRKEDTFPLTSEPSTEDSGKTDAKLIAPPSPRWQASEEECPASEGTAALNSQPSAESAIESQRPATIALQSQNIDEVCPAQEEPAPMTLTPSPMKGDIGEEGGDDPDLQPRGLLALRSTGESLSKEDRPGKVDSGVADAQLSAPLTLTPRRMKEDVGEEGGDDPDLRPRGLLALRSTGDGLPKEDRPGKVDSSIADAQLSALLAMRFKRSEGAIYTNEEMSQSRWMNSANHQDNTPIMKRGQKLEGAHGEKQGTFAPPSRFRMKKAGQSQLSVLLAQRRQKLERESCEQQDTILLSARSDTGGTSNTQHSAVPELHRQASVPVNSWLSSRDSLDTRLGTKPRLQRQASGPVTSRPLSHDMRGKELGELLAKRRQKLEEQSCVTSQYGSRDKFDTHRSALLAMRRQKSEGEQLLDDLKKGGGHFRRRWLQSSPFVNDQSAKVVDEPQEEPQIDEDVLGC